MANGWAPDSAVQDQIEDSMKDAVARANMPGGGAREDGRVCGEPILQPRRKTIAGVRTCVWCQSERDSKPRLDGINRRGSEEGQLR